MPIVIPILAILYIYIYIYFKIVFFLRIICFESIKLFIISKKVGLTIE